jgi:hypothetical protein
VDSRRDIGIDDIDPERIDRLNRLARAIRDHDEIMLQLNVLRNETKPESSSSLSLNSVQEEYLSDEQKEIMHFGDSYFVPVTSSFELKQIEEASSEVITQLMHSRGPASIDKEGAIDELPGLKTGDQRRCVLEIARKDFNSPITSQDVYRIFPNTNDYGPHITEEYKNIMQDTNFSYGQKCLKVLPIMNPLNDEIDKLYKEGIVNKNSWFYLRQNPSSDKEAKTQKTSYQAMAPLLEKKTATEPTAEKEVFSELFPTAPVTHSTPDISQQGVQSTLKTGLKK